MIIIIPTEKKTPRAETILMTSFNPSIKELLTSKGSNHLPFWPIFYLFGVKQDRYQKKLQSKSNDVKCTSV